MQVIANTQLYGSYGMVVADQEFDCPDDIVHQLLTKGMVRHAKPPQIQYEIKVIKPEAPTVSARDPFRNVRMPNPQSEGVASEGDRMFPVAELSQDRTTDPRGRGGRSGSASGR